MPQVQYSPLRQPMGFYDPVRTVEDNAPPAPLLPIIPLPEFEGHMDWLPWENGVQLNVARRYGLLTPPKTPLPLHHEDIQEQPYYMATISDTFEYVPDGQFVQDIPYNYEGIMEGPNDGTVFGPLYPIPMVTDDGETQDYGHVGFHVIDGGSEEDEDENVEDEEVQPRLMIDHLFFERDESSEDEIEGDDEMDVGE